MSLLASILANTQHTSHHSPLLVISSEDSSVSVLPFVKHFVCAASPSHPVVLVAARHAPRTLGAGSEKGKELQIVDVTGVIPGYCEEEEDVDVLKLVETRVNKAIDALGGLPVSIVFDSPETLAADAGSDALLVLLVSRLLRRLLQLGAPSTLVLPLPPSSSLLCNLTPPSLSPTLDHLALHPPSILPHIAETYALLPLTPRFHNLLASVAQRRRAAEGETTGGETPSGSYDASVAGGDGGVLVEVLRRGKKGKEGVQRAMEGVWRAKGGTEMQTAPTAQRSQRLLEAGPWEALPGLEDVVAAARRQPTTTTTTKEGPEGTVANTDDKKKPTTSAEPISTFNLSLTDSQRASRSAVPTPYAHEGSDDDDDDDTGAGGAQGGGGGIYYEPDEGDDMDADDPDDDLDF